MQHTTRHSIVATTTHSAVAHGQVIAGAKVVCCTTHVARAEADCCFESGKPVAHRSPRRLSAVSHRAPAEARGDLARSVDSRYSARPEAVLPPRLWAAWVLSQSLCG